MVSCELSTKIGGKVASLQFLHIVDHVQLKINEYDDFSLISNYHFPFNLDSIDFPKATQRGTTCVLCLGAKSRQKHIISNCCLQLDELPVASPYSKTG
jgi:hypothetical protein